MSQVTWTSWTLKIGPKAFTGVRPLRIEIRPEITFHSSGSLWWKKEWEEKTGRWEIKFVYDSGPFTSSRADVIVFDREQDAQYWFDHTYTSCFLGKVDTPMPPAPKMKLPEKKKPNKPGLHLV